MVIVADGRIDDAALRDAVEPGDLVIGADGGARRALLAGVHVDLVVGDLDSLEAADLDDLVAAGATVVRARPTRTRATPSCASWPRSTGGRRASGSSARSAGRASTTSWPTCGCSRTRASIDIDAAILDQGATIRRMGTLDGPGSLVLDGAAEDIVTLLPIDDPVEGVTTHHLRYRAR